MDKSPSSSTTSQPRRSLRRLFKGSVIAAFVAGAALTAGVAALASGAPHMHWQHGASSPERAAKHADRMLARLYSELNVNAAQQTQIDPLVKQAVTELLPLHQQLREAHSQALQLLAQTPLDRNALEQSRQRHLQLADQASRRLVQLVADVGDQLTPAQRQQLIDHLGKHHAPKQG
ncbi:Spy/CpxP family protein refolding chaperone [Paucibacter soli]|uniref:Spy/CpxP family protein refolding chaperone n=1 Tax=Paucibacter soli TaxID=3133433 RepID=UPI0030B3B4CB